MEDLNVIATDDSETAGAVVWWSLSGEVSIPRLEEVWKSADLHPALLPAAPTPEHALGLAVRDQRERHRLARRLPSGGWALVDERHMASDPDYAVIMKVNVSRSGDLIMTNPNGHPIALDIAAAYHRYRGVLDVGAASDMLIRVAAFCDATSLRERGGMYFVPRTRLTGFRACADAVESVSHHRVWRMPAMRSEEAVEAILAAVTTEAEDLARQIEADLEGTVGDRALEHRIKRTSEARNKVERYEMLLGTSTAAIRDRLDRLAAALAAAQLSLGAEGDDAR